MGNPSRGSAFKFACHVCRDSRMEDTRLERKRPAEDVYIPDEWALIPFNPSVIPDEERALVSIETRNLVAYLESDVSLMEESWEIADRQEIEGSRNSGNPITGYVYAASNPLFKSFIKIGATTKLPYERLHGLSATSVPLPFYLVNHIASFDPFGLEKKIHKFFSSVRVLPGRRTEFFQLSHKDVFLFFESVRMMQIGYPGNGVPSAAQTMFKKSACKDLRQETLKQKFAFTNLGPKLDHALLRTLSVRTYESCVDDKGLQYALLQTLKQKRDMWIKSTINSWNEKHTSNDDKILLRPETIITFTRKPFDGPEDHDVVKTIREEQMKGEGSTYERWSCARTPRSLE